MDPAPLQSHRLPPGRAPQEDILRQNAVLSQEALLRQTADAMPVMVLLINRSRQAVFANRTLVSRLGLEDSSWLGRRPGEILGCHHALDSKDGCGTTRFCGICGAAGAILGSQEGHLEVLDCRISTSDPALTYDLRVWASPFDFRGEKLTIFALMDISDEKRKAALERIFFHDVMNTATALKGLTEIFAEAPPDKAGELQRMALNSANRLIEEIRAQRDLLAAETGELVPNISLANSAPLLVELAKTYGGQHIAKNRSVIVEAGSEDVVLGTDSILLARVLGNLLKNALEASPAGACVSLACRREEASAVFSVRNPGVMPKDAQLQMFQKSFSTKGKGRGLGTYSVKLLTERYLKGKVDFESSPEKGTAFYVRLPVKPMPAKAA